MLQFSLMILIRIIIMLHCFFIDFNPYYNNASVFFIDFNQYYNNASQFSLMILIRIIMMLHCFFKG